jgi:chromosome segregation ATPase
MDLDALGLNSTFESSELQGTYQPPVDHVDTSEIEGPEDFTMNMTYWMTADLPLAQIRSRKEAKGKREAARMDTTHEEGGGQDATEEGDHVVVEEGPDADKHAERNSASASASASPSPTMRANGTADDHTYSTPASERSMPNDEKVRSFLSALPDTDMEGAIAGTPLHVPRQSFLQVPRSSPPKARSLQPTVEDYDTPRKPTQETVIHHTSAANNTSEYDALRDQITGLHSQLEQQKKNSKTRIAELETILSYTRSELEGSRIDNYRLKEKVATMEARVEQQKKDAHAAQLSAKTQAEASQSALDAKMYEFGEEMRLQNLAKLQSQREEFERQMRASSESMLQMREEMEKRSKSLERSEAELAQLRHTNKQQQQKVLEAEAHPQGSSSENAAENVTILLEQLASAQTRADNLQAQLQQATSEAMIARDEAEKKEATRVAAESKNRVNHSSRISALETNLQAARFEIECAQADATAKQQLFHTNIELSTRLRSLRTDLDTTRSNLAAREWQITQNSKLETRIAALQDQLQTSQINASSRDQEVLRHTAQGRIEGLESTITSLRQQLSEAFHDSAKVRTVAERLERDAEDMRDRLQYAQAEANRQVTDVNKKLSAMNVTKIEAEQKFREVCSQRDDLAEGHAAMLEDVRDKAEDAVRKAGALLEQERMDKRRLTKDLKRAKDELERVRVEVTGKLDDDESSDEDEDGDLKSTISTTTRERKVKLADLKEIIRKQVTDYKALKSTHISFLNEHKTTTEILSTFQSTITILEDQVTDLQAKNTTLRSALEDQEAINTAMDEKLAAMLSKLMKEKTKTVVGKRDGQWQESVKEIQSEKELLGKVLLRQWGREEIGIVEEQRGEKQKYGYMYVKREKR